MSGTQAVAKRKRDYVGVLALRGVSKAEAARRVEKKFGTGINPRDIRRAFDDMLDTRKAVNKARRVVSEKPLPPGRYKIKLGKEGLEVVDPAVIAAAPDFLVLNVRGKRVGFDVKGAPPLAKESKARRFVLDRAFDGTGTSGTGIVAEGVQFSNGQVVIHWLSQLEPLLLNVREKRENVEHALLKEGATALFDTLDRLALPGKGENAWWCMNDREIRRVLKPFRKALGKIEG